MMKKLLAAVFALLLSFPAVADQSSYQIPLTGPKAFGGTGGVADEISHGFLAAVGCSSGTSAPANGPSSAPILGQCWLNTTSNPNLVQIYDGASWVNFFSLDTASHFISLNPQRVVTGTTGDGQSDTFEGFTPNIQMNGNGGGAAVAMEFFRWDAAANGAFLVANKSRSGTIGTQGIVNNNDILINIKGNASDGVAFQEAGAFHLEIDGSPAANSMPGRWILYTTPSGGTSANEALRVDSKQILTVGGNTAISFSTNSSTSTPLLQLVNNTSNASVGIARFGAQSSLFLESSPSSTIGTYTAESSGNSLGSVIFGGADGTVFQRSASILGQADGAFSSAVSPGRLLLQTVGAGSNTLTERVRIDSTGHSLFTAGSSNPASGVNTFAVVTTASGAFGGGIGLVDTGEIGLWSSGSGANFNIGFGSSGSAALSTIGVFSNATSNNSASLSITPPGSSLALGLNITQTADGSPSASNYSGASGTGYALNNITISSDDLVILASSPSIGIGYGWAINHNFGGSNLRGARSAVGISANLTATTSASNQDREYVGSTTYVTTTVNDTGTNTGAGTAGSIFAENPFVCLCSASATNYFSMDGAEVDVSNRGGTVKYKFGWRVVLDAADNGAGVTMDNAFSVGGGGGHGVGWKIAYGLDDLGANNSPVASGGCVMCSSFAGGPYTITTGIDLTGFTISGNAFRSPNFQLTGGGALSALTYAVTGGSAGVTCSGTPTSSFASSSGIVTHC